MLSVFCFYVIKCIFVLPNSYSFFHPLQSVNFVFIFHSKIKFPYLFQVPSDICDSLCSWTPCCIREFLKIRDETFYYKFIYIYGSRTDFRYSQNTGQKLKQAGQKGCLENVFNVGFHFLQCLWSSLLIFEEP